MDNQQQQSQPSRLNVTTQIRTLYSEGVSYMTIKFYNMNLSLSVHKQEGTDQNNRPRYSRNGLFTYVNFEQAFALYKMAMDIINGNIKGEASLLFNSQHNVVLTLRRAKMNDAYVTSLSIMRDNDTAQFVFTKSNIQAIENGNQVNIPLESGLGAFAHTLAGYLHGINAERHLNKYTEEYIKTTQANQSSDANAAYQNPSFSDSNYQNYRNNNNRNTGYRNSNFGYSGNRKNNWRNNNSGYRQYNKPPAWENQNVSTANFSEYQVGQ